MYLLEGRLLTTPNQALHALLIPFYFTYSFRFRISLPLQK